MSEDEKRLADKIEAYGAGVGKCDVHDFAQAARMIRLFLAEREKSRWLEFARNEADAEFARASSSLAAALRRVEELEAAISLAITQDRAETIEACARVADGNDFFQVARQIAAAIRSLSPSREETGGNHD